LLNDPSSRIPVLAGPGTQRALLRGDGAGMPRLAQISESNAGAGKPSALALRTGDDVLTSGDEGLLPRGLKVGTVQMDDDGPRVVLAANPRGLEFVSLLLFKPPSLDKASLAKDSENSAAVGTVLRGKMEPTSGGRRSPSPIGAPMGQQPGQPGQAGWPSQ
jgi:rod shape-determining protein MreC